MAASRRAGAFELAFILRALARLAIVSHNEPVFAAVAERLVSLAEVNIHRPDEELVDAVLDLFSTPPPCR
jgi:hypothetical protein